MGMLIDFNKERLERILSDFSVATGININMVDENFNMLSERYQAHTKYCSYIQSFESGYKKCICSDKELLEKCRETKRVQFHVCHAGLVDVGVPILYADKIIGYLILGQMKRTEEFSNKLKNKDSLPLDINILKQYYDLLVLFDEERIKSVMNIALMFAKHLLLEKILFPVTNECVERTIYYINQNLSEPISIKKLSAAVGYSTSEIYKSFHKYHHCTVGDYLTKARIEYSTVLLFETDLSIEEISVKCGFSSAPYFSKKFKEINGISPLKFKKQIGAN